MSRGCFPAVSYDIYMPEFDPMNSIPSVFLECVSFSNGYDSIRFLELYQFDNGENEK